MWKESDRLIWVLASVFFSNEEHQSLAQKSDPERQRDFFSLWTLKESYMKAVGKGFNISLGSFTIRLDHGKNIQLLVDNRVQRDFFFSLYDLDSTHNMAICAKHNNFPKSVINISLNGLIANFT